MRVSGPILVLLLIGAVSFGVVISGSIPELPGASDLNTSPESGGNDFSMSETPVETTKSTIQFDLDIAEVRERVHYIVNERRSKAGAGLIDYDENLEDIAQYHSSDMATRGYFSHRSPGGETMTDRYEKFNCDCRVQLGDGEFATGGENIAKFTFENHVPTELDLAEDVVEGWMESEGHRENMLEDDWRREGIGVYAVQSGDRIAIYVTQNFC